MRNPLHPRPLLVRDPWWLLDGEWEFGEGTPDKELEWSTGATKLPQQITVPFAPQSAASGLSVDPGECVWYRRILPAAALTSGSQDRFLLHFGAVDHEADVWVNGTHVAHHRGGQVAFTADITPALRFDGADAVVVRAVDPPFDAELPRGKQAWAPKPHFIWYSRTIGIWRSVWLERVPAVNVESVSWEPDITWGVRGSVKLSDAPTRGRLRIRVAGPDQVLADAEVGVTARRVEVALPIAALRNAQARKDLLWSPELPTLLDVSITLLVDGEVVDEVDSYVGLRSVEVADGCFRLNGLPYYTRAVLAQGYWPESHFTAPDAEAMVREAELVKALGFNAVRVHQKVEDPRFLAAADRLGLLVWAEIGSAYAFSNQAVRDLITEWMEAVEQQRSHPSVVCWVPFNESWGVQDLATVPQQQSFVQAVAALTRALDGSRPVVSNDGWEHVDSDIVGVHDYVADPAVLSKRYGSAEDLERILTGAGPQGRRVAISRHQVERLLAGELPVILSEFGGISLSPDGEEWGYSSADGTDAFRERLAQLFAVVNRLDYLAGYCYTQLTDTRQEANGLLWPDRTPKLPLEVLRKIIMG